MKSYKKIGIWGLGAVACFGVMVAGFYLGEFGAKKSGRIIDEKVVAFRVEEPKEFVDYDMGSLLEYLKCKYEKDGYKVKEFAYLGDLYPDRLNNAGVNVFARGQQISYDKRYIDEAYNVYLVHRFVGGHLEEFRNFDGYMSSQIDLVAAAREKDLNMEHLEAGACEREKLPFNKEAKDVIYIYEAVRPGIIEHFGYKGIEVKSFSSMKFNNLSLEEKEKILTDAKVVIYDCDMVSLSIAKYLPFAVHNLLSFGRPVLTNWRRDIKRDLKGLEFFINFDDLANKINKY